MVFLAHYLWILHCGKKKKKKKNPLNWSSRNQYEGDRSRKSKEKIEIQNFKSDQKRQESVGSLHFRASSNFSYPDSENTCVTNQESFKQKSFQFPQPHLLPSTCPLRSDLFMSSLPQDPWACAAGSRGCCSMFEEVLLNPPFRDKGGSLFVLLSCSITGHLA